MTGLFIGMTVIDRHRPAPRRKRPDGLERKALPLCYTSACVPARIWPPCHQTKADEETKDIYEEIILLRRTGGTRALASVNNSVGSIPASSSEMLVRDDGSIVGTIGGVDCA